MDNPPDFVHPFYLLDNSRLRQILIRLNLKMERQYLSLARIIPQLTRLRLMTRLECEYGN